MKRAIDVAVSGVGLLLLSPLFLLIAVAIKVTSKGPVLFKQERGRLPDINSPDAWEKRMAEGVAALARYRAPAKAAQTGGGNA